MRSNQSITVEFQDIPKHAFDDAKVRNLIDQCRLTHKDRPTLLNLHKIQFTP